MKVTMTSQIDILKALGLDSETLSWRDLKACSLSTAELFFDLYEKDAVYARQADQICLRCPVAKECFEYGQYNEETGCWGGFWMDKGEVSESRNKHKTQEIAESLAKRLFDES